MAYKRKGRKEVKLPPKKKEGVSKGFKVFLAVMTAVVMVIVSFVVVFSGPDDDNGPPPPPPFEIALPRDDGQHNDSEEFWKLDLSIQNQFGNRFSINLDYYLHETGPQERIVTITDEGNVSGGDFFLHIREGSLGIGYEKLNLSFDSSFGSDIWTGDYTVPFQYTYEGQGTDGVDELYYLDIVMTAVKDHILLGDEGSIFLSDSEGNALGTIKGYMITRLSVTGTFRYSGETYSVTGSAWYEHQWGATSIHDMEELRLHLSTASELFLMRFFDPQDASIIEELVYYSKPDGEVVELGPGDFELEYLRYWIDPRFQPSNIRTFPSEWSFDYSSANTDITFHASVSNQIEKYHWEGSVSVSGTIDGISASGRGFALLNHPYLSQPTVLGFVRDDGVSTAPILKINIDNPISMDNATVFYRVNSGSWGSVSMSHEGGNVWNATIFVSFDDDVEAYVDAYDLAGKKVTSDLMTWTVV
jgi:predicted secreted hydrolase